MSSPRRTSPPVWLWVFWALLGVFAVWVRVADVGGDQGLANMTMWMALFLSFTVGLVWFVFRSGHVPRVRYGTLGGVVVAVLLLTTLFRFEGFTSELYPIVAWRFSERGPLPTAEGGSGVDLASTGPRDFPGFLGPERDLTVDNVALARDWDTNAPELLWRQPIGEGWSGFAVVNGWAATVEQRQEREVVTLYEASTGRLVWSHQLDARRFEHMMGGVGPRSTPTIHEGRVYVMSVYGRLAALDGATGEPIWERDLLQEYGISLEQETATVGYGRPASPLIHEGLVIVPVGAAGSRAASIAAFDAGTGELVWEGGNRQVSMASPGVATLAGVEQILVVNENWVSGHDPADGRELWAFEWPGITAADSSASQAVGVPPDRVFISKGYGAGGALWQLEIGPDGAITPRQLWHEPRVLRTKLTNVAIRDGHAYGLSEGILECVDLATGERAWKAGRYHHGQILLVGDVLLVLSEEGEIVMVEATPERTNEVLGRFQALNGHTWNNLALYGDLLLVRNAQEAAAWRLPLERPIS